ncbi:MAG: thymidine phosphorylase, partial [Pirellulales bacterium]|nr:thymidine phosphorylase [Pirellulales bacterium]
LIAKKRDSGELTADEIGSFIRGFVDGSVADYQMSAMAMAIYLRGMTDSETVALTQHMIRSGATFEWPDHLPPRIDKHSTGGLGDKVSLILAPLLACCDLIVPMISGRGLGPTGGTLDKLNAIPGFTADLTINAMRHIVQTVGCVIHGATADLVPADRKLYALRDVTATVPSIPLITASIMSKKLAEGLNALVLDVKWGSGAFMKSLVDARELAKSLVQMGTRMGLATGALITDMNQPLGRMVGNAVEVNESVDTLAGGGPNDLREITLALGIEALGLAGIESDRAEARQRLANLLDSGTALEKFERMVAAQGGNLQAPRPVAPKSEILAVRNGYIQSMDADQIGLAIIEMGGGRKRPDDALDLSVGIEMLVRLGDFVAIHQPLVHVFAPSEKAIAVHHSVLHAIHIGDDPMTPPPLIVESCHFTPSEP